ncbi:MAG: S8 family serine peptidase [Clostridiales bacterium]|nr:S8 family serine peptidase [Clostridiales bacterium]
MNLTSLFRRWGAGLLAAALLGSAVPALAVESEDTGSLFQPDSSQQVTAYAPDERVRIVIELEDAPLLDSHKVSQYASVTDFLDSNAAQSTERKLERARKAVKSQLATKLDDVEVRYEYTTVFNGLSVEADYADLETIQDLPGVKDAYVSQVYQLIEPVNETKLADSVPAIGGDIVKNTGYTGKGMVVAILDTGLDTSHEAFRNVVNAPKFSKQDIADKLASDSLRVGNVNVNSIYQSDKIPFAYDYYDNDTNVSGGNSHGTHVAGIVGANRGQVTGVAPDAQLMIMKIFGDDGSGAYDSDIIAALEDAVVLGADAVNMSLGMTAGFSEAASTKTREVYQRVKNAGISLMCAAGNEYSSSYKSAGGTDLPLASNPDNGAVASPSTYGAALSVASMNNVRATAPYLLVGNWKIRYSDPAETASKQIASLNGKYEYVDCGVGATTDFTGKSLTGKVALIQRAGEEAGEILSFAQKEKNAKAAGAKAVIIYDNVEGDLVNMATDGSIPAVFISKADGAAMLAASDKHVSFSKSYLAQFQDAYSGKMSDFSSWGVTPDLKLKPEITAPGGNIYSTLPGGLYGSMSGTSMASPHMAGAAVVMAQYITEMPGGTDMTQQEITALSNKLLMSTAVPVKNEQGLPYSPRKQGAGLVQLGRATKAKAYLSSAEGGLPKAELGSSTSGSFSFSFQANNLSTNEIQYEVGVTVLTEGTVKENGKTYLAQSPRQLGADEVTVTAPSSVTLRANDTATVKVSLALTDKGKAALGADFPNGIYLEGFVTLTPVNDGDTISLGLPFLGFYGDWSAAPIFDTSVYDADESPAVYQTMLGLFGADGSGYYLGHNLYATDNDRFDKNYIAMSNKTSNYHVTAAMAMLRNADELKFSVTDESNKEVYKETLVNQSKTYYSSSQQSYHTPMANTGFTGYTKSKFSAAKALPEGKYTYSVTATLNGKTETESFPLTIDNQAPEVVKSEVVIQNGKRLWKVTVTDNHYLQAVCATLGSTPLTGWYAPNETEEGVESVVTFDLSNQALSGLTQAKIGLVDYADNQTVSGYYNLTGGTVVDPEPTEPEKEPVLASIQAPASIQPGAELPVDFQLEKLKRVATVSFVFERDAALTGGTALGKNGFTALGDIRWNGNGNKGILMLSYLQDGTRGGSLTQAALTDVSRVVFKATAENGTNLGIKLIGVTVTGFDENGQAVTLLSNIKTPSLSIAVREGNSSKMAQWTSWTSPPASAGIRRNPATATGATLPSATSTVTTKLISKT